MLFRIDSFLPETRLFRRLRESKPAFGCYALNGPREIVEMLGDNGLDYAIIDMMVTPTNWETAADLAGTAYQFGMTPWIRLQSYPWSRSEPVDTRLTADVVRALSCGFQVIQISTDGPGPIEAALEPRMDHHRRIHLFDFQLLEHFGQDIPEGEPSADELIDARTLIVPSIESPRGLAKLDEIFALPGLRLAKLGMGDLLHVLGHSGQIEHPDVKAFVEDAVARAAKHGVSLVVNTPGRYSLEEVYETAEWMCAAGVAVVEIPYFTSIVNRFYRDALTLLRKLGDEER